MKKLTRDRVVPIISASIKDCISDIPLRIDSLFLRKKHKFPTLADGCEECTGVKIASLLSRRTGTH